MPYDHSRQAVGSPGGRRNIDRGRGYKRASSQHVEVYDLDLAAWVHLHNVPIVNATKQGREIVVVFLDPEQQDRVHTLTVTWLNSQAAKFASAVRQLKKVALSTQRQR